MLDQSIGFNSAVNGFDSSSTTSGEKNTTEKPTVESLRYPYNMKIDRDTDYLEMRIGTYKPPGFGLNEKGEVIADLPNVLTQDAQGNQTLDEKNLSTNLKNLAKLPSATLKDIHTYISLPIPQSISDSTSVSWGPDTLDPLAAFGVALGSAMIDKDKSAAQIFDSIKSNIPGALKNEGLKNAFIAAVAGKAYGALGGNVSVTSLISRASGQVLNPNLELLFNGVNLRSFPFSFDLAPRNQTEAKIVKKIIRTFKKAMTAKGSGPTAGFFISTPDIFQLTYKRGKDQHPFLNKFKPMALTDMQLNYTGSNTYATYADGTPIHITVSLTFTELNPVYAEDYDDKNDIGVGF